MVSSSGPVTMSMCRLSRSGVILSVRSWSIASSAAGDGDRDPFGERTNVGDGVREPTEESAVLKQLNKHIVL